MPSDTARLPQLLHLALCGGFSLLIVGCGGAKNSGLGVASGAGALPSIATPLSQVNPQATPVVQSVSLQPVPVTFHYIFPANITTTASVASRALSVKAARRLQASSSFIGFTSTASAISISLNVTPLGGSTTNSTGSCAASASGTSGTCTVTFTAAPGPTTLSGTLTESGNVIASFSQMQIIEPNAAQSINFTANPVVSSVALQLSAPQTYLTNPAVNAGTPANVALVVNAKDANGNTIAGTAPYVDGNGNPVSFLLNVTNTQAGGRGTVSILGPARITAPSQAAIYAHYDGNWLQSSTISVSSTSSAVTSFTPVTLATVPFATEYLVGTGPFGITTGPDGNLWFAESGANKIGKISPYGGVSTFNDYSCSCSAPRSIAVGTDGNLWIGEFTNPGKVDTMSTSGNIIRSVGVNGNVAFVTSGPDGNMWYSSSITPGGVGKISMTGKVQAYAISGTDAARGIGFGADGTLWYIDATASTVGNMTTTGTILTKYGVANVGTNRPDGVVLGPDGNIWFINTQNALLEQAGTTAVTASWNLTAGSLPERDVVGPDGNFWVTETSNNGIASVTLGGTHTAYTGLTYGFHGSPGPIGITVGPDGNLWVTENATNSVAKFVL